MEPKTHWKKNLDSRYISGEDLKYELNGLKSEMVVTIEKFNDTPSFDQKNQKETIVTGLWLSELNGTKLYKPVILNKIASRFFESEFGSAFVNDWVGKPCVVYALADKRHGFVVRFKKYFAPLKASDVSAISKLNKATTLNELVLVWDSLTLDEKALSTVLAKKDSLKTTLK